VSRSDVECVEYKQILKSFDFSFTDLLLPPMGKLLDQLTVGLKDQHFGFMKLINIEAQTNRLQGRGRNSRPANPEF
jgi:hypothetical protein